MVKTDTNLWGLFRRSTAVGVVLLLTMVGFVPVAEAGTWIRQDWSKVQRIAPGARIRVRLYKDRAPGGIWKVEGRFQSASTEAIMLRQTRRVLVSRSSPLLPADQTLTLQKQAVEKILVYRPLSKRYPGWVTLGVSASISVPTVAKTGSDVVPSGKWFLNSLFIGGPTVIAFLATPKWGGVYNVPRKLRDDPAPTPPPTATKPSSTTSESGLLLIEDKASGPELLWLHARRAVMRHDLPLDLSSVPVHAHRSGID